ncbi:hypothetical protein ACFRCG_37960 [Embleya sp. NPDC056575]|uniref:hypothetical protein n=1 Tax=unclassified Embleya TaxID=2699296 RepID=UPI0036D1C6E9
MTAVIRGVLDATQILDPIQAAVQQEDRHTPEQIEADKYSLELLKQFFPGENIDTELGYGGSSADIQRRRTLSACERDYPSQDVGYFYAPMTRFGPGANDCRATGAVAVIDNSDRRVGRNARVDPTWNDSAGINQFPADNRAALHLIASANGEAGNTLRNFVPGYQDPVNYPNMFWALEKPVNTAAKTQTVSLGVLPVYTRSSDRNFPSGLAIPSALRFKAEGSKGFSLNCTIYLDLQSASTNRGVTCT